MVPHETITTTPSGIKTCAFSIPVNLPHQAGIPICCTHYSATVCLDEYDGAWVDHEHELTCQVWEVHPVTSGRYLRGKTS